MSTPPQAVPVNVNEQEHERQSERKQMPMPMYSPLPRLPVELLLRLMGQVRTWTCLR